MGDIVVDTRGRLRRIVEPRVRLAECHEHAPGLIEQVTRFGRISSRSSVRIVPYLGVIAYTRFYV